MSKICWLLLSALLMFPMTLSAETLRIGADLTVDFTLPGDRWVMTREAPAFLLEETVEHLEHELAAQGKHPDSDALKRAAEKRLAANEAYLCNPASHACMVIDFSPLREGEEAPGKRAIAASARYAGEGLEDEEGLSEVRQKNGSTRVKGADAAYRIDATFRSHGEPRRFLGIVGFRAPYWFYFYYTDPLKDLNDYGEMEAILGTFTLSGGVKE